VTSPRIGESTLLADPLPLDGPEKLEVDPPDADTDAEHDAEYSSSPIPSCEPHTHFNQSSEIQNQRNKRSCEIKVSQCHALVFLEVREMQIRLQILVLVERLYYADGDLGPVWLT
jgi:hypothetical protein